MGFLVQPQFVQFNDNEELPVNVQNKYFLYYSTGIVGFGGIPAMYVELESADKLFDFVKAFSQNINIILTGTSDFIINKDYYINKSLYFTIIDLPGDNGSSDEIYDYFISDEVSNIKLNDVTGSSEELFIYLPNYIDNDCINVDYFNDIDNFNTLNYYIKKNSYLDYTFSNEELHNFYSTFCSTILSISIYQPTTNIDMIYKQVLEYFRSFKSDYALIGISLILGSLYGTASNSNVGCGCNTIGNNSDIQCSKTCIDYYKDAMNDYLKSMLGNYNFYQNWFFIQNEDETIVNKELIDKLKIFINEFLSLDLDISTDKKQISNCACPTVDLSSDKCNRGILNNYLKVLDWVENCKIEENINKIKIYGEQFGELLPKLQF